MNIVNQLFSNELVKKAAFSSLRKIMKENNLKGVLVKRKDDDDFDFEFIHEEMTILPTKDFEEMKKIYLEYINKNDDEL
jgi:hypothetical protein